MSDKRKLHLLNLSGELPESSKSFFDQYELEETGDYSVAEIIIAHSIDAVEAAKVQAKTLVLVFEVKDEKNSQFSVLNINLLEYPIVQKLVLRFLEDETSVHVEQAFKDGVSYFNSFKITDYHQTGYYCDVASLISLREGFNFVSIRLYLTYLMTFFSYLKQADQIMLPVDVDLAGDEKSFMIQAHCPAENFKLDSLRSAFQEASINDPAFALLGGSSHYSHLIDFYYVEKSSRLVITSLWLNSAEKAMEASQGSLFKIYQQLNGNVGKAVYGDTKEVLAKADISDELKGMKLPGKGFEEVAKDAGENTFDMTKPEKVMAGELNRMVAWILDENEKGVFTYERGAFDGELISLFLKGYPNQGMVSILEKKNYEYILNSIADENFIEKMKGDVKKEDVPKLADDIARTLGANLKNSANALNEKRKGEGKEEVDIDSLADDISKELNENKDKFENPDDIQAMAKTLVKERLELSDDDSSGVVDDSMMESMQNQIDAYEKAMGNEKVDKAVVVKMMKIIQGLKMKLLKAEANGGVSVSLDTDEALRAELAKNMAVIKNKDIQISELSEKIDALKAGDEWGSLDDADGETNPDQLKAKIRSLEGQLNVAQERVTTLSNKLDKVGDKGELLYKDKSQDRETLSDGKSDAIIKNLNDKNKQLEQRMQRLEDMKNAEILKLRDELKKVKKPAAGGASGGASDTKVLELKRENKQKADELKQSKLNAKKLGQKLRIVQGQLEQLQKNKNKGPSSKEQAAAKNIETKLNLKIGQLESLHGKAESRAKKAEQELILKKAEATKMKQEINALQNKLLAMTKKLGKKAA